MVRADQHSDGHRPISCRTGRWAATRRIAVTTCLLFIILGGFSSVWAKSTGQPVTTNPYLHPVDVSIYFGNGGFYLGVPFGPVYVQPHFRFQGYPRFYGRHGQHKRHFKPSRKYYRFKERGDRHGRHFKKGRHRGRHQQRFRR